ncbi:cytochrome P450 [Gymnopilus junonius]|uniref:Cytochrome P450 n=1 Tax=Gymnopilus junonius TaxID=109634 RepID=A0A9P5NIJ4_GYMJU|nr:cytochrome P450 [Gymnopilus junonius]
MSPISLPDFSQIVLIVVTALFYRSWFRNRKLEHIPTVGYSTPFLSVFSAIKFLFSGREIVEEGYIKYPGRVWKLPMLDEWLVVANGRQRVEDIRKASEDHLSGIRSNPVFYQWDYTVGPAVSENPYHINIVRGPLTRNLANQFDDIREEMILAFNGMIPCKGQEWTTVPVFEGLIEVISRITTRAFLGLDLCRNDEFRKLCVQSTMELVKGRLLHLFPNLLRPVLGKLITNVDGVLTGIEKHIAPIVHSRLEAERIHGSDWPDKPNDLITWLLDAAKASGEEQTVRNIAKRIVVFSFASTYSSAVAFAQALYMISERPEYIQPLREEVDSVIREEGWTKAAVGQLYKIDSFFRETQRFNGLGLVLMSRRVMKDFTFSDGTFVPAGTHLCVNSWGNHRDDEYYRSADIFDGFRFSREDPAEQPLMATPTLDYNAFGHGRPACPGRFFAVAELKMMLGYILTTYDFKLAYGCQHKMQWLESKVIPDKNIRMMFRKKQSV